MKIGGGEKRSLIITRRTLLMMMLYAQDKPRIRSSLIAKQGNVTG